MVVTTGELLEELKEFVRIYGDDCPVQIQDNPMSSSYTTDVKYYDRQKISTDYCIEPTNCFCLYSYVKRTGK